MTTKEATQDKLRDKVFKSSRIIERRLNDILKVKDIAREVGMSVSHFHHAFQTVVGESVMQHILRLRVERAASLLRHSSWQAGDIGLACGFQSAGTFSRSFKQFYGMTPQQFRGKEHAVPFLRGCLRSRPLKALEDRSLPVPTVRIETWPEIPVLCLRHYGTVKDVHLPWKDILAWAKEAIPDKREMRFFGFWFDDWSSKDDHHYRYECAIYSPYIEDIDFPEPYFIRKISAGQMAVSYAKGNLSALDRAWYSMTNGWLPFSGYQPRGAFVFDEYPSAFMLQSPVTQLVKVMSNQIALTMCLPIQKEALLY